jgi:hypothetical protein
MGKVQSNRAGENPRNKGLAKILFETERERGGGVGVCVGEGGIPGVKAGSQTTKHKGQAKDPGQTCERQIHKQIQGKTLGRYLATKAGSKT